ncbi:MAG: NAD(P)/FAD-dependent oxidoreductase [Bacteroidetes bacterium]|nr:NAD(P)/FAD-dependent oxidoreductase [Bacteroidota bacterium]
MPATHPETLVVGASISGLALAACLQKQGIDYALIEKENEIAKPWRNHYERLHLHTSKHHSHLPYKKFNQSVPRYPSRQQVIDYLEDYQQTFNIHPLLNTRATSIKRADDHWITETTSGQIISRYVVMATGAYGRPRPVSFNGIESFAGKTLHSQEYRTASDYAGQRVLVVGFGNSACEIAIDLCEKGLSPAMSVRSPVNVIPRDILGIPVLELSILLRRLKPSTADRISKPLVDLLIGDITALGLRKKPYGPLEQIQKEAAAPVLDIGTMRLIRQGRIKIYDAIDRVEGERVYFKDGQAAGFDVIVAGIGYYRDYAEIVHVDKERFEDLRRPVDKQMFFGKDGLYFCGYWVSPTGQIREIGSDAQKIARHIAGSK